MKCISGSDFGYPLMNLAEAYDYRSAFGVGWEAHGAWEIHHVLSGVVTYEFRNHASLELRGGTFLAIPPKTEHRTLDGSAAPSTRLAMRWSPPTLGKSSVRPPLGISKKDVCAIFANLAHDGLRAHVMPASMRLTARTLFAEIQTAETSADRFREARLRHLCNGMLLCLTQDFNALDVLPHGANVIQHLKRYIDRHLDSDLRMQDLMKVSGYGATHLRALFLKKEGITPMRYITRTRLAKARQLLRDDDLSLDGIAARCGFQSSSYLSTVYRKYYGVAPTHERPQRTDVRQ